LKGPCFDKSNLQKEQNKSHKPKSSNVQPALPEEPKDLNSVRVIQRKLVYIVGMPSEFANPKVSMLHLSYPKDLWVIVFTV
jgi:CCR4-NOT transcription complex subunit 4